MARAALEQARVLACRIKLHALLDCEDMVHLSVNLLLLVEGASLFTRVLPPEEEVRELREVPEGVVRGHNDGAVDVSPCLAELEAEGDVL